MLPMPSWEVGDRPVTIMLHKLSISRVAMNLRPIKFGKPLFGISMEEIILSRCKVESFQLRYSAQVALHAAGVLANLRSMSSRVWMDCQTHLSLPPQCLTSCVFQPLRPLAIS
jgi:hypothetical protein